MRPEFCHSRVSFEVIPRDHRKKVILYVFWSDFVTRKVNRTVSKCDTSL